MDILNHDDGKETSSNMTDDLHINQINSGKSASVISNDNDF